MSRTFIGTFEVKFEVELEQSVFDAVDEEFKQHIYPLSSEEDIIEYVVFNLLRGMNLSDLDGWADQDDQNAFIIDDDWYLSYYKEIEND